MPDYRVLVAGSRDWADYAKVLEAIGAVLAERMAATGHPCPDVVIVHGAAGGADALAGKAAMELGLRQGRHPADWRPAGRYDPSAGYRRNALMVGLTADVCLAFVMPCARIGCWEPHPHGSHGASNCAGLAVRAGIPVRRFTP